jgi:hypothetical protein
MSSIAMTRQTFPARIADLGFSMDVPEGFVQAELPLDEVNFDNPSESAPLMVFSSQVALAIIAVAARPAYATGSVLQWVRYLAGHFGLDLQHVQVKSVGQDGAHPAITAFATQKQDGQTMHVMLVAFEDGGRLVTAHGMCPRELWSSYGNAISDAVESITLTAPKGPKHDLDTTDAPGWERITPEQHRADSERHAKLRAAKREPAVREAERLLLSDKFDDAEHAILAVDQSIEGGVEIARMYERRLKAMVEAGLVKRERERVETVFGRALRWRQACYPEPHTQMEADDYEAGRKEDLAHLVGILGYQPEG